MAKRASATRKMFTRTIYETTATVLFFNPVTRANETVDFKGAGDLSIAQIKKAAVLPSKDCIIVSVDNLNVTGKLYALSIDDFMKYAHEVDETTGNIKTDNETETKTTKKERNKK